MDEDDVPRLPRRNKQADDPKMIGLWKIGRTIGKGSSGRVRIARHATSGQYAAVKIVSKHFLANSRVNIQDVEDQADRILLGIEREIVIMKLIDHPNIMRLYDVWETSAELYLILEYVEGGELFDYLCNKGRLSSSEALGYFQQIIRAIDYCHRFNIAHRDLKPENLLLDGNKNIKVADFGMAAWQANKDNGMLQTACGSPHYAAPEVIMGHAYNGSQSDVWSCGIILYALLSGRLPFDDEDLHTLLEKVKVGHYNMPLDIDPLAKDLISKMLQKDLEKRITIPQIMDHPFYLSMKPKDINTTTPKLDEIAHPIKSISEIDSDIFANLRTLWHGTPDEEIMESLKNDQQNWQKGVYHLLVNYRSKHLENYDEEEELAHQSSKHRNRSKIPVRAPIGRAGRSVTSIPPRCDPPTPRRAGRDNASRSQMLSHDGLSPPQITLHLPSPSSSQQPSPVSLSSPSLSSPLSPTSPMSPVWNMLNLPAIDVPETQDDKLQQFFHQIVDHLNAMQVRATMNGSSEQGAFPHIMVPSIPYRQSTAPPPTPIGAQFEAPGATSPPLRIDERPSASASLVSPLEGQDFHSLDTSNNKENEENDAGIRRPHRPSPLKLTAQNVDQENNRIRPVAFGGGIIKKSSLRRNNDEVVGTAIPNRHVQIVEPPKAERPKSDKQRNFDPNSPSLSSDSSFTLGPAEPRHSWFNNVFKFKPTTYHLLSVQDAQTSREECRRLLTNLGVKVVLTHAEGMGVLRCKLDEVKDPAGVMAVMKAMRFRVEVHRPSPAQTVVGYQVALYVVQEKGPLSSFKSMYSRLKREWDLDASRTPLDSALVSPALTAGGRYAEAVYPA